MIIWLVQTIVVTIYTIPFSGWWYIGLDWSDARGGVGPDTVFPISRSDAWFGCESGGGSKHDARREGLSKEGNNFNWNVTMLCFDSKCEHNAIIMTFVFTNVMTPESNS